MFLINMDITLIIIVILISFLQSIFGVGILLFGTPILLSLDYGFIESLNILLPLSLLVNLVQLFSDYNNVNYKFYLAFIKFTIPFLFLSLFFIIKIEINMNYLVGIFIILVSIQNNVPYLKKNIIKLLNEKIFLILTGLVHGLSNLGGSLLTVIIYSKNMSKNETRSTIVVCYATFALIQLITIFLVANKYYFENIIIYCTISFVVVILSERYLYNQIKPKFYNKSFELFLLFMGVFLILK